MFKFIWIIFVGILFVSCGENQRHNNNYSLWEEGKVYYKFSKEISRTHRKKIEKCFDEIENNTRCIYFIKDSERHDSLIIRYSTTKTNYATVGYNEENSMNILSESMIYRSIYHETLHVLGMFHEHQRPDRDQYIKVFHENIECDRLNNFKIQDIYFYDIYKLGYDVDSVMHYQPDAFSNCKGQTIEFFNDDHQFSRKPTPLDYKKLISMYSQQESV